MEIEGEEAGSRGVRLMGAWLGIVVIRSIARKDAVEDPSESAAVLNWQILRKTWVISCIIKDIMAQPP